jgi:hypothetical protein
MESLELRTEMSETMQVRIESTHTREYRSNGEAGREITSAKYADDGGLTLGGEADDQICSFGLHQPLTSGQISRWEAQLEPKLRKRQVRIRRVGQAFLLLEDDSQDCE